MSHDSLARLMHEFSSSKIPAFSAAESCYLSAMAAISHDPLVGEVEIEPVPRKTTSKRLDMEASIGHSGPSVQYSVAHMRHREPSEDENDTGYDEWRDHCSELHTPTRRTGFHFSKIDINPCYDSLRPPTFAKQIEPGEWDFNAVSRRGFIKTSSGNLLEAPSNLTRSTSSIHLTPSAQFGLTSWQEDDIFCEPTASRKTACTFTTPELTLKSSPESPSSPTPRGPTFSKSCIPFLPIDHANSSRYFSPPSQRCAGHQSRYATHGRAIQHQLRIHLRECQKLKGDAITAQADRIRERAQKTSAASSKLPHSRSFWSFKEPAVEDAEKRARIERGKDSGWSRDRFDPARHIQLSDDAMAELRGTT